MIKDKRLALRNKWDKVFTSQEMYSDPDEWYQWDVTMWGLDEDVVEYTYAVNKRFYQDVLGSTQQQFPPFPEFVSWSVQHGIDWESLLIHPHAKTLLHIWLARYTS
jgi:hypothetical protein